MITPNDALQFIKDHHNGEIPYTFGKNEYARWMAEFANYTVTKHLHKHGVSGKRPTDEEIEQWVKGHGYYGHCTQEYHEGLEEGARWAINKMSEAAGVPTRSDGKAGD